MISAIISIYKPPVARLNRCLSAVLPQVDEVVISGDQDTPWPIHGILEHEKIKLVRHQEAKTGYGKKATLGAGESMGEFLHFLNDDVYLQANVIEKCMAEMRDNVAVVTHTLRYPNGQIQYAGKFRVPDRVVFMHVDYRQQKSRYTNPVEQESACGASMLVRREAFLAVGGFDKAYFLYAEDDDLVMRLRQAGWKVMFTPLAEAVHEEHSSTSITPGWRKVMEESNAIFAKRWSFYFKQNPNTSIIGRFNSAIKIERDTILIRRKNAAGDVLLATPVIAALKRKSPNSQIIVETDYPDILNDNPDVAIATAASAPLNQIRTIDLTMAYESRPHLNYLAAYAEVAGVSLEDCVPRIFLNAADRAYANKLLGSTDRWCVINAANVCHNRVWPLDRYASVIQHLRNIGFKVAQVGTYDGIAGCDLDLTRKTSIHQMAAVIEQCGLFIGIDSFPLHVATAVGATTIGLFGVTMPERVLATRQNVWPVTSDSNHPSTGARHSGVTDYVPECQSNPMETITPESVMRTIDGVVFRLVPSLAPNTTPTAVTATLVYIHVADAMHEEMARQFVRSYHLNPPGMGHRTMIVCQNCEPSEEIMALFKTLPELYVYHHDDTGFDIGAYLAVAKFIETDLMICFGGSTFVRQAGWMRRMAEAFEKHGPGLFGPTATYQISPHLNTTGFWCPPSLLANFKRRVVTRKDRYEFEHGRTAFWKLVHRRLPVKLVTWSGEYDWPDWRKPENIYHRGDQSNCLTFFRASLNYQLASPYYKRQHEAKADTLVSRLGL